jgi:glycosyltransferase involved in cell wall biosynthesis
VANLLAAGLKERGRIVHRTFELRDAEWSGSLCTSADLAGLVPAGDILHLHTSTDWRACLGALETRSGRLLLTLHDTRLLSGGCSDPLDCLGYGFGCPEPCPQGKIGAAACQRAQTALVRCLRLHLAGPSRWILELAQRVFSGTTGVTFHLIPNGISQPLGVSMPSKEYREAARRRWGISSRARLVVFSAHGGEAAIFKGGAHWLEIWRAVKEGVPEAVAIMAGGSLHAREGDLIRIPYMEQAELHALLSAADLFLSPSLADNHPLAVLEAFAAGVPVLAFAVGGIPEQIEHQKNGWLIPAGDVKAFSRAAAHLLKNHTLLRDTGRQGFETWRACFTLEHMLDGYEAAYAMIA